jgi:hypothetical protein
MDEIQHRLVRLETQNRRFKQLAAILLIVAAMLFVMGQAAPVKKTVEAQEFILRDASGKVRARLSMIVPKGAMPGSAPIPQFALIDEKGNERVRLLGGTGDWGISGLYLQDNEGRDRAEFLQGSTLGSMLVQQDEKGQVKTRIIDGEVLAVNEVSSLKMNSYEFNLKAAGGETRARLFMPEKHTEDMKLPFMDKPVPVTFNPTPVLALYDEKGKARTYMNGEGSIDASNISVSDPKSKASGSLGFLSRDGATLALSNGQGELRAFLEPGHLELTDDTGFKAGIGVQKNLVTVRTGETHQTSAASVMLFDKNGTVLWKAP